MWEIAIKELSKSILSKEASVWTAIVGMGVYILSKVPDFAVKCAEAYVKVLKAKKEGRKLQNDLESDK